MCEHLKHSTGTRKFSGIENAMVYHQGCERPSLPDKKLLSSDSFSSEELSLSRNSSFSSCSSSATGSSGYGCTLDTDSSVSRSSVRINPRLDLPIRYAVNKPDEHSYMRKNTGKHRLERGSLTRDKQVLDRNSCQPNTKSENEHRFCFPERSISETELLLSRSSHLCSPEGLIISTPRVKGTQLSTSEKRARSKSESYDEKSSPNIEGSRAISKDPTTKSKRSVSAKRRENTTADWCTVDEATMKRCLVLLEANCEGKKGQKRKDAAKRIALLESQLEQVCQERDSALRERNEMMHDRDRIKCERDALELERDNLLRDKNILEKELVNRSNVIDHLKEHLGLAVIPVNLTPRNMNSPVSIPVPKDMSTTYEHDAPAGRRFRTRPRSKSETKTPEFYFPDQILKTNAYTCL